MQAYALRELEAMPSYMEAMRHCVEQILDKTLSAINYANEEEEGKALKRKEKKWTNCMKSQITQNDEGNYTLLKENRLGQFNMRFEKFKEILAKSEELRELASHPDNGNLNINV